MVSAALLHRYRADVPLRYWKPIQTGTEQDDDPAEVGRLGRCGSEELLPSGVRLPIPVSPHLAARLSGCTIRLEPLIDFVIAETARCGAGLQACERGKVGRGFSPATSRALKGPRYAPRHNDETGSREPRWIVEGAGGTLVPVNESETMADLMVRLGLPIIVVTRTTLGTINHTLLTLEALRRRALHVVGVVMVGHRDRENRAAIEQYGDVAVLGEMPWLDPLTPEEVAKWATAELDPGRRLLELLR